MGAVYIHCFVCLFAVCWIVTHFRELCSLFGVSLFCIDFHTKPLINSLISHPFIKQSLFCPMFEFRQAFLISLWALCRQPFGCARSLFWEVMAVCSRRTVIQLYWPVTRWLHFSEKIHRFPYFQEDGKTKTLATFRVTRACSRIENYGVNMV